MRVVVQLTAFDEGIEVGRQALSLQTADETGQIPRMGPDIPYAATGARSFRVGAPYRLLVAGLLRRLGQPVLRIFDLNQPEIVPGLPFAAISRACRIIG